MNNKIKESLDRSMKIIKEYSNNENIKEMIKVLEEKDNKNDNTLSKEKLKKLGQLTYKDYSNKKREK